jgi:hypothetical protein
MSETPRPMQPPADPLIDEVRAVRKSISDEFGNDVDRLCEDLRRIERQYASRIVHPHRRNSPSNER